MSLEDAARLAQTATPLVAFCALVVASCSAYMAIKTYQRSAEFTAVMDIWKAVREERSKFQVVADKPTRNDKEYASACTHFFNQLELVAYSINNGLIGTRGMSFLKPWLVKELLHIYQSETQGPIFLSHVVDPSAPQAYIELLKICPFPPKKLKDSSGIPAEA